MTIAFPFLPVDRLHALARGDELPDRVEGAALLADVWGFTVLADALVAAFGPQRGAEELTRHLNLVYGALIGPVDRYGGSVLGFSGDAITCWFDAGTAGLVEASRRAVTCAVAMQDAVKAFARIEVSGGSGAVSIAPKIAVAAGAARRFRVGDGEIQYLDALAGATLDRLAATERRAARGEVLVENETAMSLGDGIAVREWRGGTGVRDGEAAVIERVARGASPSPWPPLAASALKGDQLRPWLLSAVHERLLSGQGEFLAELRPAVAVFVKFEGIDYERDDGAGEKLDVFVRRVQRVLARYGGTLVDLTFGDKGSYLYAAFGAPTAHEDDADRAMRAALELRALPEELSFLAPLQIGISRGRTRAGPIGGPSRRAYAVTGNEVNVAARLMQAAAPGEIVVSEHVLAGTREAFACRALAPMAIKGRSEPVRVVALEGVGERAVRVEEKSDGASMVGRERELADVVEKMKLAGGGSGQLVAITADAGVGKSRLLGAVVRAAKGRGFAVHAGEAQSFGTIATYLAWHGVWRGVLGVDAVGTPEAQTRALEAALARIDPTLVPRLPLLGPAVGVAIADNDLTRQFEAKLRKDSLEALLATCLRACAARGPMVIAIEDAHWMDPLSIDLLESIGRAVAGMSVLLVVTSRPHDGEGRATARLAALPHFTELKLGELTRADSAVLIDRIVRARRGAGATAGEKFIEVLHARAEGNPFLVEELVGFLLDRGIDPELGVLPAATELPSNLAGAILGRIDQLTTTQQTTLRIASVIGRSYRFDWLWGVHPELGVPAVVRGDLEVLSQRDLMLLEASEPDATYVFKHSLVQEVAYESLPFAMRAKLHEQLAEWLEERGEASVDLLAFHYGRSKNAEKQREYFRKAGDAAAARYANEAAGEYYERLAEIVEGTTQVETLLKLGGAKANAARWDDAETVYLRALAKGSDAPSSLRARTYLALGDTCTRRAAYERAQSWFEQARVDAEKVGDRRIQVTALVEEANAYRLRGKLEEARQTLEESVRLHEDGGDKQTLARIYHVLGNVTGDKPDMRGAQTWWRKSLDLRRALGDRSGVATLTVNMALGAFFQQQYAEARTLLDEAIPLCRALGMRWGTSRANQLLGMVLVAQGEVSRANNIFGETFALLRDLGALRELAELLTSTVLTWSIQSKPDGMLRVLRLAGAGSALFEHLGSPLPAYLRPQIERCVEAIHAQLGQEASDVAWSEGRAMKWSHAVAYALAEATARPSND